MVKVFPETLKDSTIILGEASVTAGGMSVPKGSFITLEAMVSQLIHLVM